MKEIGVLSCVQYFEKAFPHAINSGFCNRTMSLWSTFRMAAEAATRKSHRPEFRHCRVSIRSVFNLNDTGRRRTIVSSIGGSGGGGGADAAVVYRWGGDRLNERHCIADDLLCQSVHPSYSSLAVGAPRVPLVARSVSAIRRPDIMHSPSLIIVRLWSMKSRSVGCDRLTRHSSRAAYTPVAPAAAAHLLSDLVHQPTIMSLCWTNNKRLKRFCWCGRKKIFPDFL